MNKEIKQNKIMGKESHMVTIPRIQLEEMEKIIKRKDIHIMLDVRNPNAANCWKMPLTQITLAGDTDGEEIKKLLDMKIQEIMSEQFKATIEKLTESNRKVREKYYNLEQKLPWWKRRN